MDAFLLDDTKEKSAGFYIALYWLKHLRRRERSTITATADVPTLATA